MSHRNAPSDTPCSAYGGETGGRGGGRFHFTPTETGAEYFKLPSILIYEGTIII